MTIYYAARLTLIIQKIVHVIPMQKKKSIYQNSIDWCCFNLIDILQHLIKDISIDEAYLFR